MLKFSIGIKWELQAKGETEASFKNRYGCAVSLGCSEDKPTTVGTAYQDLCDQILANLSSILSEIILIILGSEHRQDLS